MAPAPQALRARPLQALGMVPTLAPTQALALVQALVQALPQIPVGHPPSPHLPAPDLVPPQLLAPQLLQARGQTLDPRREWAPPHQAHPQHQPQVHPGLTPQVGQVHHFLVQLLPPRQQLVAKQIPRLDPRPLPLGPGQPAQRRPTCQSCQNLGQALAMGHVLHQRLGLRQQLGTQRARMQLLPPQHRHFLRSRPLQEAYLHQLPLLELALQVEPQQPALPNFPHQFLA